MKASEDLNSCFSRKVIVFTSYFNDKKFDLIEEIVNVITEKISVRRQISVETVVVCIPYLAKSFYTLLSITNGEILNRLSCFIP